MDHSTAYARRKGHGDFAADWAEALRAFAEAKRRAEEAEIAALRQAAPSPCSPPASPTSPPGRGEVVVSGGKVRRASAERWGKRKEALFFDALAATANAGMAAEAAGVSPNAVFARRLKHPLFAAKWEAVVRTARASIDLHLVEESKKSFDPATLETGEVKPRVTIDQAIKISQLGATKKQREEELPDPFAEQAASMSEDDVEALRAKLVRKLRRMRDRDMPEMIAQGWSFDESWEHMIPPGWIMAPDYKPKQWREPREGDGA